MQVLAQAATEATGGAGEQNAFEWFGHCSIFSIK
jgi:hypothetical protein